MVGPQLRLARAATYTMMMCQRAMLEKAFGAPDDRVRELTKIWAAGMAERSNITVHAHHFDAVDWSRPVIVMANHQSYLDVLALYQALPNAFGIMAKKTLFAVPFFGGVMRALGCVPVDRAKKNDAVASIREAAARVRSGNTIAVFPEGTRSPGDRIGKLKKGAFYLSQEAQVPILPVGIRGTARLMPRRNTELHGGEIEVVAGQLIAPPDHSQASRKAVMIAVREALAELAEVPVMD